MSAVPAPTSDNSVEPNSAWLAGTLSCIAGTVDVISWITLSGLFTAHVTGNLVVMAADGVAGREMHLAAAIAVPLFIAITATIGAAVQILQPPGQCKVQLLLAGQFVLLAACAAFVSIAGSSGDIWVAVLAIAAMATQNALLHLSVTPVPTTAVMTGNIVSATLAMVALLLAKGALRDAAQKQWRQASPILLGFVVGCVAGAGAAAWLDRGAWFVPAALSALLWAGVGGSGSSRFKTGGI
ncbi:YoaK family protein [Sphingomonas sp. 22176]|uniref:YoaK family protein n=1 Tax=Sphingomonas sp. 22176 TaxID=3453884 RepID=UPI003F83A879